MPSLKPRRLRTGAPPGVGSATGLLKPSSIHRSTRVPRVARRSWRRPNITASGVEADTVRLRSPWLSAGSSRSLARNAHLLQLTRLAIGEAVAVVEQGGTEADDDRQVGRWRLRAEHPGVGRREGRVARLGRLALHDASAPRRRARAACPAARLRRRRTRRGRRPRRPEWRVAAHRSGARRQRRPGPRTTAAGPLPRAPPPRAPSRRPTATDAAVAAPATAAPARRPLRETLSTNGPPPTPAPGLRRPRLGPPRARPDRP